MQEIGRRVLRHFEPCSALSFVPLAASANGVLSEPFSLSYQVTRKNMAFLLNQLTTVGRKHISIRLLGES